MMTCVLTDNDHLLVLERCKTFKRDKTISYLILISCPVWALDTRIHIIYQI